MGFTKGSSEALAHMLKIRNMRGNKKTSDQTMDNNNNNNIEQTQSKRGGRLIKGSQEAKEYMAILRSKRK